MMTRRGFLQALLSLPVVAAIPQFAALAKALPVVEPELRTGEIGVVEGVRFHESWLRINGEPFECWAVSVENSVDYIDVIDGDSFVARKIAGLQRNRLTARIPWMPQIRQHFYEGKALDIEAQFGPAILRATGYLHKYADAVPVAGEPYSDITIELMQVRYEDSL